jgi:predicted SAM-dependent methyltransferase
MGGKGIMNCAVCVLQKNMAIIRELKKRILLSFKKSAQKNLEGLAEKRKHVEQLLKNTDRVHLGCGDVRMKGFINVDFRTTLATDVQHDCRDLSVFPSGSLSVVFSNAFFEHLYKNDRVKCLQSIYTALRPEGEIVFTGFPDFERVARAYLEKKKGLISERFDLYHVYRFTHGDPEHVDGWWLEQLHKTIFDKDEVEQILQQAGYRHYIIFDYAFRQDDLVVTMGFVAFKQKPSIVMNRDWLIKHIAQFSSDVRGDSIEVLVIAA